VQHAHSRPGARATFRSALRRYSAQSGWARPNRNAQVQTRRHPAPEFLPAPSVASLVALTHPDRCQRRRARSGLSALTDTTGAEPTRTITVIAITQPAATAPVQSQTQPVPRALPQLAAASVLRDPAVAPSPRPSHPQCAPTRNASRGRAADATRIAMAQHHSTFCRLSLAGAPRRPPPRRRPLPRQHRRGHDPHQVPGTPCALPARQSCPCPPRWAS